MRNLSARAESWPIAGTFAISRGSKTEARVVVAELREGSVRGRGECVPYARYSETIEGVLEAIEDLRTELERGLDRNRLAERLPAGAARNAVDCALWDLEGKRTGRRVWELAGVPEPGPLVTAYTISLDTPEAMSEAARSASDRPLLKLKLGGDTDLERVGAVRAAAPNARLVVDANEAWSLARLRELGPALAELGVELIEQPLPASEDTSLAQLSCPVPLCADESVHDSATLEPLRSPLRPHQRQARQDRRPDGSPRACRRRATGRDGHRRGLHGGDLAGHGAGGPPGRASARRRPGRPPPPRARPPPRHPLRRKRDAPPSV